MLKSRRNYEANTISTTRLANAARNELFAMAQDEHIDFDHEGRGILHIYRTRRDHEHACRVNDLLRKGGLERRAVSDEEIRGIEPGLQGKFYGGFYTPSDSTGDIHKFTRGLVHACERRGARFWGDRVVQTIERGSTGVRIGTATGSTEQTKGVDDTIEADGVVVCAGVASRKLAHALGDRLNVYPVKGYSIMVDLLSDASQTAAPWVSLLDDDTKIVTSRLGANGLRIAGTAEFNDFNRDIRAARIDPLSRRPAGSFPK